MLIIYTILAIVFVPLIVSGLLLKFAPGPVLGFFDQQLFKALDVDNYNRQSPYRHNGFQPVHQQVSQLELDITGAIPDDLVGAYIRNGTNRQFETTRARSHMFNGAGMLHQIQFHDGKAYYSNTYVKTPRFLVEEKQGEEVYLEFGNIAGCAKHGLFSIALNFLKMRCGVCRYVIPYGTV